MLEDKSAQHEQQVVNKYQDIHWTYNMNTRDYVMRVYADGDSGPISIFLPPVAEAKGRFYSLVCRNADPVNTVRITDMDDSECWVNDIIFNGKCDKVLLYSDGLCWHAFGGGDWPGVLTTPGPGTTPGPSTTSSPTSEVPQQ